MLSLQKHDYVRIDGCTPAELRQGYCDRFQHDEQCLIAVLSITTANAGTYILVITLIASDMHVPHPLPHSIYLLLCFQV